jgi:Mrp family chromosome partitioning ATPase
MGNILEALQKAHREKRERLDQLKGEYEQPTPEGGERLRSPGLIITADPSSLAAEQLRIARNMIRAHERERPIRTVVVSSPSTVPGASLVTCNLAAVFASEPGGEVLLLDAAPGGRGLSSLFGATELPGLYTFVTGKLESASDPEELLPLCRETDVDRLRFLPPGPPSDVPSSPFLQGGLSQVPVVLADHFRVVIIDAPAILENMDVAVFSGMADGVILVVGAGYTSKEDLLRSVQLLRGSGSNLLGCILSGAMESIPRWLRRLLMVGPA